MYLYMLKASVCFFYSLDYYSLAYELDFFSEIVNVGETPCVFIISYHHEPVGIHH
jgi:hypothetical protein